MLEKVKEILEEILGINADEITEETSFKGDLEADSLELAETAAMLEDEFGIEFSSEDLEDIATVGDVIEYIESHI